MRFVQAQGIGCPGHAIFARPIPNRPARFRARPALWGLKLIIRLGIHHARIAEQGAGFVGRLNTIPNLHAVDGARPKLVKLGEVEGGFDGIEIGRAFELHHHLSRDVAVRRIICLIGIGRRGQQGSQQCHQSDQADEGEFNRSV